MSKHLSNAYRQGVSKVERDYMNGNGERDLESILHAIERKSISSNDAAELARLAGEAHASVHLAEQGHIKSNPRKQTDKSKAAVERSRVVLRRAHAILASRGCSFKDAMVTAWQEAKAGAIKQNSGITRGNDALWLAAYDGQPWAQFEMARTGRSYNVPNMWAGQAYANRGLQKGQSNMAIAAKRYRAGEFASMQDALSAVSAERRRR